ncbi:Uncharacterised protein [Vibrio cholerae]|nr:Uncharacterised protein [Vibrio cholerae]
MGKAAREFHVFTIARERHREVLNLNFCRKSNVIFVFLSQSICRQTAAFFVNPFIVGERTADQDFGVDFIAFNSHNL